MQSQCSLLFGMLLGLVFILTDFPSRANGSFSEDFENGLGQWTGRGGGHDGGLIVDDPLASGHGKVLTFTNLATGGDTFVQNPISMSAPITISFDYLGLPGLGGTNGDLGGFLGVVYSLTATYQGTDLFWYAGTRNSYPGLVLSLEDDGNWHHYSIQLHSTAMPPFHLMLEDFVGSGGVPRDVFFDNISVTGAILQLTSPSLSNGVVRFSVTGPVSSNCVVQVSSNLVNWLAFATNLIPPGGVVPVSDNLVPNRVERFYRAFLR